MTSSTLIPPSNQRLPGRLKFWETRGGKVSPFHGIRDYVLEHGLPGPQETEKLARELKIPAATIRGVATFYADFRDRGENSVCDGTSCRLAGSEQVCEQLKERGCSYRKVYCLGYCDRSPAILDG